MMGGWKKVLLASVINLVFFSFGASALDFTPLGKITATQGHIGPNCRTVQFKESPAGNYRYLRIPNNSSSQDNGIAAVVLAALVANRDVMIAYDPAVTSGCGTEPQISYISIQ